MLAFFRRIISQIIRRSTHIHHEPINKVSLVVLILIDIFVLINVFTGLNNISEWTLNPVEEFPCYSAYETYQTDKNKGTLEVNSRTIEKQIDENKLSPSNSFDTSNRLGKVSPLCDNHTRLSKAVNAPEIIKLKDEITRIRDQNSALNSEIATLQSEYNSTLLEKIAGQSRQKSINRSNADQIKSEIDNRKKQIADNKNRIIERQKNLVQQPASAAYLQLLNNTSEYETLKANYRSAEFWYPNKQLLLQTLFLLPLIAIAYFWHSAAIRRDKGLQGLLSWHLLLIFCIPLLIKFFEFIQFGNLIGKVIEVIITLFGGLVFIASYVLILIIPLLGFGLIKFLQIFVFNPRVQAKKRIQNVRCINCNFKLRLNDDFCAYCGFEQYRQCSNCQHRTYKFTNFCSSCGHRVEESN